MSGRRLSAPCFEYSHYPASHGKAPFIDLVLILEEKLLFTSLTDQNSCSNMFGWLQGVLQSESRCWQISALDCWDG